MRSGSPKATASGEGARVEPEPVECGDPQRCGYQVTGVVEPPVGCAIGETGLATYTTRSSEIAARRTCLIPNFHADRCYTEHEVDLHEFKLAERAEALGIEVATLEPARGDFNDDLRRLGREALAARVRIQLEADDAARFCGR